MKKYYFVTMVLKNTSTAEDEMTLDGRYVVEDENELDGIAENLATSYGKTKEDFDVHYEKSTVQDFIKDEEDHLKDFIIKDFLNRNDKYERLPAKEYLNVLRHIDDDLYYDVLREENKLKRMQKIVRKSIDLKTITVADYDALTIALLHAKDNDELIALLQQYKTK